MVERIGMAVDAAALKECQDEDGTEPAPPSRRSDLANTLLWALAAAAITLVFGAVLDVLEAWLP